jgi:hypothetical protein
MRAIDLIPYVDEVVNYLKTKNVWEDYQNNLRSVGLEYFFKQKINDFIEPRVETYINMLSSIKRFQTHLLLAAFIFSSHPEHDWWNYVGEIENFHHEERITDWENLRFSDLTPSQKELYRSIYPKTFKI